MHKDLEYIFWRRKTIFIVSRFYLPQMQFNFKNQQIYIEMAVPPQNTENLFVDEMHIKHASIKTRFHLGL